MTDPDGTDKAQVDQIAEGFIALGKLLVAAAVVVLAIWLLISML